MNDDAVNFLNREGLKFFGKVNASISHELKNILAIISETAGLLNDLTELAKTGKKLELSMLENCSDNISEEVQRGFRTIKQMNRFAHSVDDFVSEADPVEVLDLALQLTRFLSYSTRVMTDFTDRPDKPVLSSPFLMQNLFYQVLCLMYKTAGHNGEVHVASSTREADAVHLIFSASGAPESPDFPGPGIPRTAGVLGASLAKDPGPTSLDVRIPYTNPAFSRPEI